MKTAEELLSDHLSFGRIPDFKNEGLWIPSLWEVARDLEDYVRKGLLVEIPVSTTLAEIGNAYLELNRIKRTNRLLSDDYGGVTEKVLFKTIPGGTMYELAFSKGERSGYFGSFKRAP